MGMSDLHPLYPPERAETAPRASSLLLAPRPSRNKYFWGLFTNERTSPAVLALRVLVALLTVIVVTVGCLRFTGTKTNVGLTERRLGANEDSDSSDSLESPLDPEVCADLLSSPPSLEGPTAGGPPASFAQENSVAAQKRGREEDEEQSDEVQRAKKPALSGPSSKEDASKGSEEASSTVDGSAEFPPLGIIEEDPATSGQSESSEDLLSWNEISDEDLVQGVLLAEDEEFLDGLLSELGKTVGAGSPSSVSAADDSATSGKSNTASAADERPAPLSTQRRSSSSSPSSREEVLDGLLSELGKTAGAGSPSSVSAADDSATSGKSGTASAADERPAPLSTQRRSSSSSPSSREEVLDGLLSELEKTAGAGSPSSVSAADDSATSGNEVRPEPIWVATPSTSSDPGQRRPDPSPRPPAQDPFYRVPALPANIEVIPVEYFGRQPDPHSRTLFRAFHMIRNRLMKPLLREVDVENLRYKLANLFQLGKWGMPEVSSGCTDRKLVYGLAVRFLTLDAAWACSEALGPSMDREAWWGAFSSDVVGSSLEARSKSELRHSGIEFLALTNGLLLYLSTLAGQQFVKASYPAGDNNDALTINKMSPLLAHFRCEDRLSFCAACKRGRSLLKFSVNLKLHGLSGRLQQPLQRLLTMDDQLLFAEVGSDYRMFHPWNPKWQKHIPLTATHIDGHLTACCDSVPVVSAIKRMDVVVLTFFECLC
ncbi:hypothetical protein Efla_000744 [Eimeria flavescens]